MSSPIRRGLATWLVVALLAPPALARAQKAPVIVDPFDEPAPTPAPSPTDPLAAEELDEVVNAMPPGEDQELSSGGAARADYDSQRIVIDAQSGRPRGFLGGGGSTVLSGAALYLAMDRPDLASRYRLRSAARWTLLLGSSLAFGIGLYAAATAEPATCSDELTTGEFNACENAAESQASDQENTGALVCVLGAVAFASTWMWLKPDPVSVGQAKRLAWQHNRRLRGSLGLIDVSLVPVPGQLTLAPSFSGGGLGLRLVGWF